MEKFDYPLTEHFSFFEMTKTDHANLLENNRIAALAVKDTLVATAILMEQIRAIVNEPIEVHSGFRCAELNKAIGGAEKSQHLKGEACDFSSIGPDIEESIKEFFCKILTGIIEVGLQFGQLIIERQNRGYRVSRWLHISLGPPFRPLSRCGEVFDMTNGFYRLIKQIPQKYNGRE